MVGEELLHSSHISDSDRERGMVSHHVEELSGGYSSLHEATFRAVDLNVINPSTVATLTSAIQHSLHSLLNSLTANLSHFPDILSVFQYLKEQHLCNALADLLVYILHNSSAD